MLKKMSKHWTLCFILLVCLLINFSDCVRPINPEKRSRLGKSSEDGVSPTDRADLKLESGCPDRCVCYETIVRCMFLKLKNVPDIPRNTTNL